MNTIEFEDIKVGMSVSYSQTITDADVKTFAGLSGDHNPGVCKEFCVNGSIV